MVHFCIDWCACFVVLLTKHLCFVCMCCGLQRFHLCYGIDCFVMISVREVVLFFLRKLFVVPYRCWSLLLVAKWKEIKKESRWWKQEEFKWKKLEMIVKLWISADVVGARMQHHLHSVSALRPRERDTCIKHNSVKWKITFSAVLFTPSKEYHWVRYYGMLKKRAHTTLTLLSQSSLSTSSAGEKEKEQKRMIVIWRKYAVVIDLYYLFIIFKRKTSLLNFEIFRYKQNKVHQMPRHIKCNFFQPIEMCIMRNVHFSRRIFEIYGLKFVLRLSIYLSILAATKCGKISRIRKKKHKHRSI